MTFDRNSPDAVFSHILTRLDSQDQTLARIEAGVNKTNGRVNKLERERWFQRGAAAVIGAAFAGVVEYFRK